MAADLPPAAPAAAPVAALVAPAPASAPINVEANGFLFSVVGNTLLPAETIEAALRDAKTPKEAIDALDLAYRQAGYLFTAVGAQVSDKLVAIRVLQGRISEIDAPAELMPFLRRLQDREGLVRRDLLYTAALVDFYTARQGTRAKAELSKAAQVGGTKMTVTEEPIPGAKPWNASLAFGNFGSRYSSRYTAAASGAVRPGGGLELTAGYTQGLPGLTGDSAGSSYKGAQFGASVVTPWGVYALAYSRTQYRIGERAAPLYPAGDIETVALSGTQLAYADETKRVALTQSVNRVSNRQTVFDADYPDSPEFPNPVPPLVDQPYTYVSLGAQYNQTIGAFGETASLAAGLTYQQGLSPRMGTFNPAGPGVPTPRFSVGQANVTLSTTLPGGFSAAASASGQFTDDTVPQNQQWVLGGVGNLTAWLPAVLVGDSGALARLAVTSPAYRWGEFGLSGSVFAEGGTARYSYRGATDPTTRSLADAGLSLTGTASFGLTATLAYAWPLWYRNVSGVIRESVDSNRANLYFTLGQSF